MSTLTTKGTGAWGALGACVARVLRTTPTWGRSWVLTCWFLTIPLRAAPETFWFSGISNLLLLEGILQDVDTAWGDISRVLPDSLAFRQYNAHLKYHCLNANWYRHCELYSSVQFSRSVVSDSLRLHGLQHARPPCPSPTPRVYSNSCPLGQWCHPTVLSSVIPFSSCFNLSQHQGLF